MEKVDYNEKERLAWSSYVFLEKEKQKKNLVGYRQYHMAPPKTATILLLLLPNGRIATRQPKNKEKPTRHSQGS
jgi:hypothetical protein